MGETAFDAVIRTFAFEYLQLRQQLTPGATRGSAEQVDEVRGNGEIVSLQRQASGDNLLTAVALHQQLGR
jgi:hypothetical protein